MAQATKSTFRSSCCGSPKMTIRGGDDEFGDNSWVQCGGCGQPCEPCEPLDLDFWIQRSDGWERYAKELEQQLEVAGCTCGVSKPDEFGNRDLIESPDCPYHGEDSE